MRSADIARRYGFGKFLSIQAQDFIEDDPETTVKGLEGIIPEHSSSGLH